MTAPAPPDTLGLAMRLVKLQREVAARDAVKRKADGDAEYATWAAAKVAAIRAELNGHPRAQALFDDLIQPGRSVYARASRRAAKSHTITRALLAVAILRRGNCMYFGLTGPAVDVTIWREVWAPLVARHFGDTARMNATLHITELPQGGRIVFSGTDDVRHAMTKLGGSAAGGLVIIDEIQSQPEETLNLLLDEVLPPIVSDDHGQGSGTLCRAGTIPRVPHGRAYDDWHGQDGKGNKWGADSIIRHSFNRFDNPFLKNQDAELRRFLAERPNLTESSPVVQRDWFNVEVYDEADRAWTGFRDAIYPAGNLYEGEAPEQEFYAFAADPGGQDRFAIEGIGWSSKSPLVYHADEWCTEPDERVFLSKARDAAIAFDNKYRPIKWYWDSNSDNVNDTYTSDWGVMMIRPAAKGAFRGQFDRMNDLLAQRRLLIRKGSILHRDMVKARLNPKGYQTGNDPWDSSYHGDCHDAARYALAGYFELYKAPTPPSKLTEIERMQQDEEAARAKLYAPKVTYGQMPTPGATPGTNYGGYR
jgi:hypothetical protein